MVPTPGSAGDDSGAGTIPGGNAGASAADTGATIVTVNATAVTTARPARTTSERDMAISIDAPSGKPRRRKNYRGKPTRRGQYDST
jgi:hypothetical protein